MTGHKNTTASLICPIVKREQIKEGNNKEEKTVVIREKRKENPGFTVINVTAFHNVLKTFICFQFYPFESKIDDRCLPSKKKLANAFSCV